MPYPASHEFHRRRIERIVLGELELGSENATLERRLLGALDERLPVKQVIFRHRACCDAFGGVGREVAVFVEESFLRDGRCHLPPKKKKRAKIQERGVYIVCISMQFGGVSRGYSQEEV